MELVEKLQSLDESSDGAPRWARRAALGAWVCGLTSVGLAWAQARWYVFHPHYLPLCLLFAGLGVSTFVALLGCLWRCARGPRRVRAAILAVVAMLPAGFWAYVGVTAQRNHERRWVPNTFAMRLAQVMGAAFMHADVDLRYRHRLESKRLVMFYEPRHSEHPERVDRPERDLAVMDEHLARLEERLGGTISSKVYWIRGRVLGLEGLSFHGLSLGSKESPEVGEQYRGDRHELAHAALDWFRVPGSDPPYLVHEGWAMSQCGDGRLELARAAADSRRENPAIGVRELLGPDWYYRDSGPVYSVGGAFVDFLIRTRGGVRFRRFYVECQPDTLEAKCREIFETDLDDLEADFWDDVQKAVVGIPDGRAYSAQTGPSHQRDARIRRTDGCPIASHQTTTTSPSRRRAAFKSASQKEGHACDQFSVPRHPWDRDLHPMWLGSWRACPFRSSHLPGRLDPGAIRDGLWSQRCTPARPECYSIAFDRVEIVLATTTPSRKTDHAEKPPRGDANYTLSV